MQLSEHFDSSEFSRDAEIPPDCLPVLTKLCQNVLEPLRAKFGVFLITSGYRPPDANAAAHGQPNSEHIYSPAWCAADGYPQIGSPRDVFDWLRGPECAAMPWHQLILEHGANGSSVVHISLNTNMPGVRSCKEGATHNAEPYVNVDCVSYAPTPQQPLDVDQSTQI